MTREEIIDGLEIYTVGRTNKAKVNITVEELQKFINAIKSLKQESTIKNDLEISIGEAIEDMRVIQAYFNGETQSVELAIEIMQKYQKIEEIVKRYERPDKEETDKFYWDVIGVVEE